MIALCSSSLEASEKLLEYDSVLQRKITKGKQPTELAVAFFIICSVRTVHKDALRCDDNRIVVFVLSKL